MRCAISSPDLLTFHLNDKADHALVLLLAADAVALRCGGGLQQVEVCPVVGRDAGVVGGLVVHCKRIKIILLKKRKYIF